MKLHTVKDQSNSSSFLVVDNPLNINHVGVSVAY